MLFSPQILARSLKRTSGASGTTWDAAKKAAAISLSGGNLIATWSGTKGTVLSVAGKSAGKWYAEIYFQAYANADVWGIAKSTISLTDFPDNVVNGSYLNNASGVFSPDGGTVTQNAVIGAAPRTFMIAYDADAGKLWLGSGGTFPGSPAAGTGQTVSGLSGTFYIAAGAQGSSTGNATINSTLTYSPPSGFSQWG